MEKIAVVVMKGEGAIVVGQEEPVWKGAIAQGNCRGDRTATVRNPVN